MSELRVMSFNIRNAASDKNTTESWEARLDNLVALIRGASPDLIGFQEVLHGQYLDLAGRFPEYSSVGAGRDDGINAGEYAAVFYRKDRFGLIESGSFWLSETPEKPSLGWDAACIRICTYAKLLDNKTQKIFTQYNTHLDHIGQTAVLESAKLIRGAMLDKKIPAFVTGDFNMAEKSAPYNILTQGGLSDAKYSAGSSMSHGTFHGYDPGGNTKSDSPIDYLFYTDGDFNIKEYKVLVNGGKGAYTSDHYPVLVIFA
jgi:endonuclease/exonuclease/phosphatase family metal-dependent hydrolase